MKINSNEMLLINKKGLKLRNNQPQTSTTVENPVINPEQTMKALDLQAQNNIAFQGLQKTLNAGALKKAGKSAIMALAILAGASSMQSCINISSETEILIDFEEITNAFNDMLALLKEQAAQNEASLEEQKAQTAWLESIYNEIVSTNGTLTDFYAAVTAHYMVDENLQQQMLDQLIANGKTEEEAAQVLKEFKDLYAAKEYEKAFAIIVDLLSSIDGTLKDIYSLALNMFEKMNEHHAEYMNAKNKEIEMLVNIYDQNANYYSINNEKMDSLIAINSRMEKSIANIEVATDELLAIGQDSTKFEELMLAIADSKTEIDYEKFEKIGKMIGIDIKSLANTFKREEAKTRREFVDAINTFKHVYLKTQKAHTKELKEINNKLDILKTFPGLIGDAIKAGLDESLADIAELIQANTDAIETNTNVLGEKIDGFSAKLDSVLEKLDALISDFGTFSKNVSDYHNAYSAKWDASLESLGVFADSLLTQGANAIDELQNLKQAQNITNKYIESLMPKVDEIVELLDSLGNITVNTTVIDNDTVIVNNNNTNINNNISNDTIIVNNEVTGGVDTVIVDGGMTIEDLKAYLEESAPKVYDRLLQLLIDTGLDKIAGDVATLKETAIAFKDEYAANIKEMAGQLDEIIDLLGNLKNLDPSSPDYSEILKQISDDLKNFKHNCECNHTNDTNNENTKPNEGILGDLEDILG